MASSGPKTPMFAMANAAADDDNFEEEEDDNTSTAQTSTQPDTASKPFTLFSGSFFSTKTGDTTRAEATKADVVEGEEDEDEPDTSIPSRASLPASSAPVTSLSASSGTGLSVTGTHSAHVTDTKAVSAKHYSKSERQVVDMNLALRKAPVKKLRETYANIRAELGPTQVSLTASVRAASEASVLSASIDEQLSALSDKFQAIKPVFSV